MLRHEIYTTRRISLKQLSHHELGRYLIENFIGELPALERAVFDLGCVQPDYNVTTYIKGSRRVCRLRGHNYKNASACVERITKKLHKAKRWGVLEYYRLGKLTHYIADAFTFAHNEMFKGDLLAHKQYECDLQDYFVDYIHGHREGYDYSGTGFEIIVKLHEEYEKGEQGVENDSYFACEAARLVTQSLAVPAVEPGVVRRAVPASGLALGVLSSFSANGVVLGVIDVLGS